VGSEVREFKHLIKLFLVSILGSVAAVAHSGELVICEPKAAEFKTDGLAPERIAIQMKIHLASEEAVSLDTSPIPNVRESQLTWEKSSAGFFSFGRTRFKGSGFGQVSGQPVDVIFDLSRQDYGYKGRFNELEYSCVRFTEYRFDLATYLETGSTAPVDQTVSEDRTIHVKAIEIDDRASKETESTNEAPKPRDTKFASLSDENDGRICVYATLDGGWDPRPDYKHWVVEAKRRGLTCDVGGEKQSVVQSGVSQQSIEAAEVLALRERLAKLEAEKKATQQSISQDTQRPSIRITDSRSDGARGTIVGVAIDNSGIAEIRINNEIVSFDDSGKFSFSTFIPPGGKELEIVAYDLKGLSATQIARLEREAVTQVAKVSFDSLDPTTRRAKSNNNAVALIVGVAEYEKTAGAEYADRDAQVFYDYANLKLGIPQNRIQTLVNDKADVVGLLSGINKWLKRSVKQGESDVYIFFAGHGLASDDGDTAYLIPYDGAPDFLERTAISRDEVFREVSSVNPRSVTVFLDTCYSGDTRGETRLIAGRPLSIKLQEQSLPAGFAVLTAAGGDQIAKPLKEAQHGLFSYFLMKGMEGGADANSDNQITARELHTYVRENVVQQSGGSQVPELQGDAERVLVRFR
jgi:hypothetical protein